MGSCREVSIFVVLELLSDLFKSYVLLSCELVSIFVVLELLSAVDGIVLFPKSS